MTPTTLLTGGSFFCRGQVRQVSTSGEETLVLEVPTQPSGSGRLPDGSLVVVSLTDQRGPVVALPGTEIPTVAHPIRLSVTSPTYRLPPPAPSSAHGPS